MTPFVQDPDFTLWHGDALEVLRELPAESVNCVATSPPFYALRDYGVKGQIGLEDSPEAWVAALAAVFAEARRVLTRDGTLWVECGDSYSSGNREGHGTRIGAKQGTNRSSANGHDWYRAPMGEGIKPKDLLGQPWLLAFALRADGWYLRQAIIWHKPNAMPESAKDRCTTAHSYVFLLSKSPRYWFDDEAIAEPAEWARWGDQTVPKYEGTETASGWMQPQTKAALTDRFRNSDRYVNQGFAPANSLIARGGRTTNGQKERTDERRGFDNRLERADGMKNARSVWTIPTEGFPEAHFATWPQALVERIIKAGCPESGVVLDPFMGSGTTALVARRLGRRSVGIELNASYCEMAARRLGQQSLLADLA